MSLNSSLGLIIGQLSKQCLILFIGFFQIRSEIITQFQYRLLHHKNFIQEDRSRFLLINSLISFLLAKVKGPHGYIDRTFKEATEDCLGVYEEEQGDISQLRVLSGFLKDRENGVAPRQP